MSLPTVADFRTRFTEITSEIASDLLVTRAIASEGASINATSWGDDYAEAVKLAAALVLVSALPAFKGYVNLYRTKFVDIDKARRVLTDLAIADRVGILETDTAVVSDLVDDHDEAISTAQDDIDAVEITVAAHTLELADHETRIAGIE